MVRGRTASPKVLRTSPTRRLQRLNDGGASSLSMDSGEGHGRFTVARTEKPWGYELLWARTVHYAAKVLHVEANASLSLQLHEEKHETMYVLAGLVQLEIQVGSEATVSLLGPGDSYHIPAGVVHRLSAVVESDVLEASTPQLHDVVRLADEYGRAPTVETAAPKTAALYQTE
jgi:mannose-6-phosphate isomerase